MEGVIKEIVLENNLLNTIQKNGIKVIHLKHIIKFLQIYREYDVTPNVTPNCLIIKKSPNIFPVSMYFTQDWKTIIKKSENELTEKILQESKSSLNLKLEEFHGNLTYYLKNNDISKIQNLLTAYTKLEDKLFNRQIVKFMKVCSTVSLKTIRTKMNLEYEFSRDLKNRLLSHQISHNYINTRRFKQKSQNNNESLITSSLIVETNEEQTKIENGLSDETTSERTNDLSDLANILADLTADDIPPAQYTNSQELRSQGETSVIGNHAEMDIETNRLNGKFVSDNVFNLSRRNISDSELNLLSKGLSFVPTSERIDRYQLKNDLERFGRNIHLKMFYANEPTPSFSNSPAFRIPSKWTLLIRDTLLELYLSEIEHEIMKIEERGSNYPNLMKEEHEAIESFVNDDSIII